MKKIIIFKLNILFILLFLIVVNKANGQNCKTDTIYSFSLAHTGAGNYEKRPAYKTFISRTNNDLSIDYISQLYIPYLKLYRNYTKTHYEMHPTFKDQYTLQTSHSFDTISNNWINVYKTERSYNSKGKTTNISFYNWNKINQNWRQTSNSTKTYLNDTLTLSEENQSFVPHINSLRNNSKYYYTYDSKGNILTETYSEWDTVSNSFADYRRYTFTYNAFSQIETELIEYLDKPLNRFVKYSLTENIYTTTNKLNIKTYKLWDEGAGIFINNSKEINTYNANDLVSVELHQNYNTGSSTWIDNYKYDLTYNAQGLLTDKTSTNFDVATMTWTPYYKETIDYNMTGKKVKEYLYEWITASSEWREKSLVTNKYNSGDTLILYEYYQRNDAINGLEIYSKREYEYNNSNPIYIERSYSSFNSTLGYFQNASQNEHLCKIANTHLNKMMAYNNAFIYPNPCNTGFVEIETNKICTYEIYGVDGKLLKIGKIQPNEKIDVRFLTTGIYIININEKTTKLIIE